MVENIKHGLTGYTKRKCRCDECRAAMNAARRRSNAKHREANRERRRKYRAENRDQINARRREMSDAARERQNETRRRRYAHNAEKLRGERRVWVERNPDKIRESSAKYYAARRDKLIATNRERYRANRDRYQRANRRWAESNREKMRAYLAEWRRQHPRALSEYRAARRTKVRRAGYFRVTRRDWERLVRRHDGRCFYCGKREVPLTQDHVVPISRGGRHSIGNLVPACRACNCSKQARLLVEWRAHKRSLTI